MMEEYVQNWKARGVKVLQLMNAAMKSIEVDGNTTAYDYTLTILTDSKVGSGMMVTYGNSTWLSQGFGGTSHAVR